MSCYLFVEGSVINNTKMSLLTHSAYGVLAVYEH